MNRVTKCRSTLRRILLCKWGIKMRKYIHVCHSDNWNTHNHQSTESPQNTQTHTVHWNTQTSQPIETPKLPRHVIHPEKHTDHSVHWNTLIKSIETCKSPSPLKHPSVAPPFKIQFNEKDYIKNLLSPPTPPPRKNNNNTCTSAKLPQTYNGIHLTSVAGNHPHPPPRPSFLPFFLLCDI